MNSQQAFINTNSTLLGTSLSTCVKDTESTKKSGVKAGKETDTTSGKKKLYKNFIYKEFTLIYPSAYIDRNWKEMSKNIVLTYPDIRIDMHTCNTYDMSSTGQVSFVRQYHVQYFSEFSGNTCYSKYK